MRDLINKQVFELLLAARVPVMTFTQVLEQDFRFGLFLLSRDAQGCYSPHYDMIFVDDRTLFSPLCDMTLMHELVHWSGHASRLDRMPMGRAPSQEESATEEVVAQLGMFKLAMHLGFSESFYRPLLDTYIETFAAHADMEKAEKQAADAVNFIISLLPAQADLFSAA